MPGGTGRGFSVKVPDAGVPPAAGEGPGPPGRGRPPDPPNTSRERSTWPASRVHGWRRTKLVIWRLRGAARCVAAPDELAEKKVVVGMFSADDAPGIPHEDGARDEA